MVLKSLPVIGGSFVYAMAIRHIRPIETDTYLASGTLISMATKEQRVQVNLTAEEHAQVRLIAAKCKVSRSKAIAMIVRRWLAEREFKVTDAVAGVREEETGRPAKTDSLRQD
jgi:hypothetical protein